MSFNKINNILKDASKNGINILLEDGKLKIRKEKDSVIDPVLFERISSHKEEIKAHLSACQTTGFSDHKIIQPSTSSQEIIPLSYAQERIWVIDKIQGSIQYNLHWIFNVRGKIDNIAFNAAFREILRRHHVLRTVIHEEEGVGYQKVLPLDGWSVNFLTTDQLLDIGHTIETFVEEQCNKSFDLRQDWMMNIHLMQQSENTYTLLVLVHHLVFDGWSVAIMVKELTAIYNGFIHNHKPELPDLTIQYTDYTIWQRQFLSESILTAQLNYWTSKLHNVKALILNTDFVRPLVSGTSGEQWTGHIDAQLTSSLRSLSQKQGATLFMTLLSAFNVLLYRYTGQPDICVGIPIAGRPLEDLNGLIGFFVNTLALRNQINEDDSFFTLLADTKKNTLEAYEHQDIPFVKIIEGLGVKRDLGRQPVFQIMFAMQDGQALTSLTLGDAELQLQDNKEVSSRFDLELNVFEHGDGLKISWTYCTDLFKRETIEGMAGHYNTLLRSIISDPHQRIRDLNILDQQEQMYLLEDLHAMDTTYPQELTLVDLYADQASQSPDSVAVIFGTDSLSYAELDTKSNQLGHYLRSLGIGKESLVPICIERSPDMIIGILGILKAGAAYVPVDPDYPLDRISYILQDTRASVVVTSTKSSSVFSSCKELKIVELNGIAAIDILQEYTLPVQSSVKADHLAYIIYTSGSTGHPKGVMIEHRNVVRLFKNDNPIYKFDETDVWTMFHSFCFDFSVWEMYGALLHGGRLILVAKNVAQDSNLFSDLLIEHGVTVLNQTPSSFYALQEQLIEKQAYASLRYVIFGGEVLQQALLIPWPDEAKSCLHINMYGITEITVHATYYALKAGNLHNNKNIIGKAIPTLGIYILDKHQQLIPIGASGEIYVSGAGLARGYLNLPELTASRFIPSPFIQGEQLYRTGDLGCLLPDGNIEFLGRSDEQVKIRGYRIEPGEIESVMYRSKIVKQAVVIAREDASGSSKQLLGYVVPEEGYSKEFLRSYLHNTLPDYMIPALIIELDSLPLTSNGKIDKRALADISIGGLMQNSYVAPRNELEQALSEIWQELLGLERVGIHDDFFEIGGHSLLATRFSSAIRKRLQLELSLNYFFQHPRIADLSAHLSVQTESQGVPAIRPEARPADIPLSFAQERLWFIDNLQGSIQYHIPLVFRLEGAVDISGLESSFREIVERHEVLRTVIREKEGIGYQQVQPSSAWTLHYQEHAELATKNIDLKQWIAAQISKPFDLAGDYMLRLHLVKVSAREHMLVVVLHHIVADGWSMSVLVREMLELYSSFIQQKQANLPALPLQYADYALWQRKYLEGALLDKQLDYWKVKLAGVSPLYLPTDYPRPVIQSTRGHTIYFYLDKEISEQLQTLSQQEGVTLFMMMLSVFKILLYRYSGQQDLCVGIAIAGRTQKETESSIGFFVNALAIRSKVNKQLLFRDFLQQVKSTMVEGYTYQDVPFEKIIEAVVGKREVIGNPLVQVMFVLQNTPDIPAIALGGMKITPELQQDETSKFDITFDLRQKADGLEFRVEYCNDLFDQATIERMFGHYEQLLRSVVQDIATPVSALKLLSQEERKQLIDGFNTVI